MDKPIIRVIFPKPTSGYWDGGAKDGGDFTPGIYLPVHPGKGSCIKWGSWGLNFWFVAKAGRSWKEAASIARRRLVHMVRVPGTRVEIVS